MQRLYYPLNDESKYGKWVVSDMNVVRDVATVSVYIYIGCHGNNQTYVHTGNSRRRQ